MQKDLKSETDWVPFTRRTDDPKLRWLERQLRGRGISCRRNGESFHAPVLEVLKQDFDSAWEVLSGVDDLADDDSRWERELAEMCSCSVRSPFTLDFNPPKCWECGKPLFLLVRGK